MFLAFVVGGMTAGATAVLAAVRSVALTFLLLSLLPLTIRFFSEGDFLSLAMGTMILIYLAALIFVADTNYRANLRVLHLHREKQVLLTRAVSEKTAASELNRQLQQTLTEYHQIEQALLKANHKLEAQIQARSQELEREIAERRLYMTEMQHAVYYDTLTQLPNRYLLQDRLQHALSRAQHSGNLVAVLHLTLNRLRLLSSGFGYHTGDALLRTAAARLQTCVSDADTLAYLGGDDFIIVLEDLTDDDQALAAAQRIIAAMAQPLNVSEHRFHVRGSIGLSIFPADGTGAEVLLQHANLALHDIDRHSDSGCQRYTATIANRVTDRLTLGMELQRVLPEDALSLYYQPQIDLLTAQVIGCEALLRWEHPQRGLLSAEVIIASAKTANLLMQLDDWVLYTACRQIKAWQNAGLAVPYVAVNLSAHQFQQADLPGRVARVLAEVGLPACHLKLELTEDMLVQNIDQAVLTINALRALGIQIALDDFGTGYASLDYLKRFVIDWLKIDRSFISDLVTSPNDAAIVSTMISLAHDFGTRVIAEGIEQEAQLRFLQSRHCDAVQGYYLSSPLTATAADEWFRTPPVNITRQLNAQRTVLIVDDEHDYRELWSEVLKRDGYHILTAGDPQQAMQVLASEPVDVVLSDYHMPAMNGVDFLRQVRRLHPGVIRVLTSAFGNVHVLAGAVNEGAIFRFLFKPVELEQLRDTVRAAVLSRTGYDFAGHKTAAEVTV
jgi:diguanylate cyclase (GGDEF)-like protein